MIAEKVETLRFDETRHEYWLGSRRIPSVTEILRGVGIIDAQWFTDESRHRGNFVHQACHFLDENDLDWATIDPAVTGCDYRPYIRAWERAKLETRMQIIDIERRGYNPTWLYAGTLDRRVFWNGREWIIDLKTLGSIGAAWPKWARWQTGAYDMMLPPDDGGQARKRASILLYPDGTWRPDFHTNFYDGREFLAFLTTYRALLANSGKGE